MGRNKIPYHLGNYSFPCGFAARERIISLVVRNFIPTRAIGQESYIIALEGDNLLSKIIIALVVKSLLPCRAIIIIIALVM